MGTTSQVEINLPSISKSKVRQSTKKSLICAARQGDLQAFNRLVLVYQDRAYTLAYYLFGNPTAAEDAVERAFITAFQTISKVRDGSFQSWLSQIVAQKCLEKLRREKRHPTKSRKSCIPPGEESKSPQSPAAPGERSDKTEIEGFLLRCLARLSAEHRTILVLVDLLGMDYSEAAQIIGCPPGRIKGRLAQARLQIQHFFQEDWACYKPVTWQEQTVTYQI